MVMTAVVAVLVVGHVVERRALAELVAGARADVRLRGALLTSEMQRFRLLPVALSGDSDLGAALGGAAPSRRRLDIKLERLAATTGAAVIYVLGNDGRAIAASNWRLPASFVGQDYAFRHYYRAARATGSASQFALGTISHTPGLYLADRTDRGGVVVVKLEFDRIEHEWRRAGGITFATDARGVVLVTSRPDWRFATTQPLSPAAARRFREDLQSGPASLAPLPVMAAGDGRVAVAGDPAGDPLAVADTVANGLHLRLLVPTRDVANSVRTAQFAALLAALAVSAGVAALLGRSRRALARTAAAARHTAELEAMVAARTAELRREIGERTASEARADTLREGLRQANRLATLGQVTASVAHETAQPVAAIRAYAANGTRFLADGRTAAAADNFAAIGRLTERIGTVTAELRSFARKGSNNIEPLPLAVAIDGTTLILKARLSRIAFAATMPPGLCVLADKVRLEQVLVNLLQNAIEALDGREDARITLDAVAQGDRVVVMVADNGPGVAPAVAGRLFTPFVTSRPAGLGLGLVISHDIMVDMGGTLRLIDGGGGAGGGSGDGSDGGARFEIGLRRAP